MPSGYRPYGKTIADLAVALGTVSGSSVYVPSGVVTLNVYSASSGGTHITDLLAADGLTVITTVVTDANGKIPRFYAPNTYTEIWLDDGSNRYQSIPGDLGSASSVASTGITDSTTTGRALLTAANAAAAKSTLSLDQVDNTSDSAKATSAGPIKTALDGKALASHTHVSTNITDFNSAVDARVAAYLANNAYHQSYVAASAGALPTTAADGSIGLIVSSGAATKSFADLGSILTGTPASSHSLTPTDPGSTFSGKTSCVVYALVATANGAGSALYPSSFTGAGLTWTAVANTDQITTNTTVCCRVYKGTGTGALTAVTASFASAMDRCAIILVQHVNGAGSVAQVLNPPFSGSSNAPAGTFGSTVSSSRQIVSFLAENSGSQTMTPGTGLTTIGTQRFGGTGVTPAFSVAAATGDPAIQSPAWSTSSTSQKILQALEVT